MRYKVEIVFDEEEAESPEDAAADVLKWIRENREVCVQIMDDEGRKWSFDESMEEGERIYEIKG